MNRLIAEKIQKLIEEYHYWDARLLKISCEYFGDELTIVFEDSNGDVRILFSGCSKICLNSRIEDREIPLRELQLSQIPYFLQDIDITECKIENKILLNCKIMAPPLDIEIVCKVISVNKE